MILFCNSNRTQYRPIITVLAKFSIRILYLLLQKPRFMAGLTDGISYHNEEDYVYLFGNYIEELVEEQNWNFSAEQDWVSDDPVEQKLIEKYWAVLTDVSDEQLTEEELDIIEGCEQSWWRLYNDDHEVCFSYGCDEIIKISEQFPKDTLDYIQSNAPGFQPPTKEEIEEMLDQKRILVVELNNEIDELKKLLDSE